MLSLSSTSFDHVRARDSIYEDLLKLHETRKNASKGKPHQVSMHGLVFVLFYDSTADILYVQCSDGANPNTHVMEKGVSWNTFKTRCRNNAQHRLENRLRKWFPIPLRPVISPNVSYNSRTYCFEIIKICSILTVCEIIKRLNHNR